MGAGQPDLGGGVCMCRAPVRVTPSTHTALLMCQTLFLPQTSEVVLLNPFYR